MNHSMPGLPVHHQLLESTHTRVHCVGDAIQPSHRPFKVCCKVGLVVLNSLNFCLSEKLFIFPSILNEILARNSILGCRFFPFSTLNISCHSLLACRVSAERSGVKHMGFPLYVTCCFSLAASNILSLCLVFVSLISMCLDVCFALGLSCMGLFVSLGHD